jgi:YgiT-type zinc finger domain-containing protein
MQKDFDGKWHEVAEEVMSGAQRAPQEWRIEHPRATLSEIEKALDERLAKMRVRMLGDAALASAAAEMTSGEEREPTLCPECGGRMEARGKQERLLTSQHNHTLRLERSYAVCPHCGAGFFPSG